MQKATAALSLKSTRSSGALDYFYMKVGSLMGSGYVP